MSYDFTYNQVLETVVLAIQRTCCNVTTGPLPVPQGVLPGAQVYYRAFPGEISRHYWMNVYQYGITAVHPDVMRNHAINWIKTSTGLSSQKVSTNGLLVYLKAVVYYLQTTCTLRTSIFYPGQSWVVYEAKDPTPFNGAVTGEIVTASTIDSLYLNLKNRIKTSRSRPITYSCGSRNV